MENIKLRIDSLAYGGNGVGRHEGIVYFVPFSAPGDILEVRVTKKEKRYREAEIVRIIEQSAGRVTPPCPWFGECGGCQWQHISYDEQLRQKTSELEAALTKNRLPEAVDKLNPIIRSPKQFGYRRTARFKLGGSGKTSPDYGFYRTESHELIKIDRCMLLDQRINNYVPEMKFDEAELFGFDLFMNDEGRVQPFLRRTNRDQGADFFQANTDVNELMKKYIRDTVLSRLNSAGRKPGKARILDLYCGDGNLSLQFAETSRTITGWDYSRTAVERGRTGAETAMKSFPGCRISYHQSDVSQSWKKIAAHAGQADCILVDPPRKGLKKQAARIAGLKAPHIVYVSCSPPALVRDLGIFFEYGYSLEELQPLDMFPQTYHLETVAVLTRK